LRRIIDWDDVGAVPLKLSAISIAQSFFPKESEIKLDDNLDELFKQELSRIEQERKLSSEWPQMFVHSKENLLLFDILRLGNGFTELRKNHASLLIEILRRSTEKLALAETEWKAFAHEFYIDQGLPIPDYPQFIEIQESLGLYGHSRLERIFWRFKRSLLKRWNVFFDKFWSML
jgi:hypothetical protein